MLIYVLCVTMYLVIGCLFQCFVDDDVPVFIFWPLVLLMLLIFGPPAFLKDNISKLKSKVKNRKLDQKPTAILVGMVNAKMLKHLDGFDYAGWKHEHIVVRDIGTDIKVLQISGEKIRLNSYEKKKLAEGYNKAQSLHKEFLKNKEELDRQMTALSKIEGIMKKPPVIH